MRIFFVLLVAMTGLVIYDIATDKIHVLLALLGIGIGSIIGFVAGRMFNMKWHPEEKKVIGQLDTLGIIILVLYIAISIGRRWIFAHWLGGATLTAFTFCFAEGAILGRLLSMGRNIKRVLAEEGVVE